MKIITSPAKTPAAGSCAAALPEGSFSESPDCTLFADFVAKSRVKYYNQLCSTNYADTCAACTGGDYAGIVKGDGSMQGITLKSSTESGVRSVSEAVAGSEFTDFAFQICESQFNRCKLRGNK